MDTLLDYLESGCVEGLVAFSLSACAWLGQVHMNKVFLFR